ncbi:MAG: UDP-glucose/GDP-mannose dehydrogenase family protein [Candidatus Magasanikbacteria bacterium CG10_big_fil_rev_8_21_14_0_10_47_10]|uniref:UDP-glucose 6-dehydrogenase n=1 Tax=Candidatus Magasanikbacteria bacterium CG10_big_fil_rev_8_21_14_0_10_47_10 TaxID=1974652 RepID=A0A2H0TPS3_9BACT|nr:MAG: UDP-glucose/GDP-mannose dehydrogenase family protein [Candidatus Magasanikbacteria bacterium CG10_big_fil_rev_8_21_14_0_10_47_10]
MYYILHMNILYIGAGFVGACSAAVAADSGHSTLVFDIDQKKIQMLASGDRDTIESCLFEKGLGDLLVRNKERIAFTTDYSNVVNFLASVDAIFMCLPTPEIGETGESNMEYYNSAAEQLATALAKRDGGAQQKYIVIVNKSTVPIDTVDHTQEILDKAGVRNVGVVSNPEFLVEGKAIQGSLKPDRIVVGAWQEKDFDVMRNVYRRFYDSPDVEYIEVNPKEAAAGKLLANFYLFNKLAICFDVIGRTAEAFDAISFENLRRILINDDRIGKWGFYDSLYAGGSCFIKDARSLSHQLQTAGQEAVLVNETYIANKRQLETFLGRAQKDAGFDWAGKRVALLGLAFKRDTNDTRNSPSIDIMHFLEGKNVSHVSLYDPAASDMFKSMFAETEKRTYASHEFDAVKDADVIIIATDWPQFRGLADVIVSELQTRPLIMDGRRMLHHRYADLRNAGFDVIAVGSPFIRGHA